MKFYKIRTLGRKKARYKVECHIEYKDEPMKKFEVNVMAYSAIQAKRLVKNDMKMLPKKAFRFKRKKQ